MSKKIISISGLYTLFLLFSFGMTAAAQGTEDVNNYYSNPQKGIKPNAPHPFVDSSITSKTDDIIVELTGYIPDTVQKRDTTTEFQLDHRTLRTEEYSLYPNDSWYGSWYGYWHSPFYDPWYYSWGYDPWMMSHCWSCSHYWGWNYGWGWGPYWSWNYGWGYPWYWNSYLYHAYYGGFAWGRPHQGYGQGGGYGLITSNNRGNGNRSGSSANRNTVRRGGVDLNNGGRAPRGSVSGTGTVGSRGTSNNSRGTAVAARGTSGRYAKPAAATTGRDATMASRGSNATRGNSYTRSGSYSRSSYDNSSRSSYRSSSSSSSSRSSDTYRSSSSSSRNSSSYRSSSSSSRSSSSSFRSSGSSSSFRSSGSGGFRSSGGGGSSRGRR